MSDENAGFLGRWSRRKARSRASADERDVDADPVVAKPIADEAGHPASPPAAPPPDTNGPADSEASSRAADPRQNTGLAAQSPPAPTREDLATLTHDSDFSAFMQPAVEPDVKLAALKKLFSDPHYNIMDGLDVYIDDYSSPEKLPESTLRQMVSARVLALVQDDPAPRSGDDPSGPARPANEAATGDDAGGSVLESGASTGQTPSDGQTHFDFPEPESPR